MVVQPIKCMVSMTQTPWPDNHHTRECWTLIPVTAPYCKISQPLRHSLPADLYFFASKWLRLQYHFLQPFHKAAILLTSTLHTTVSTTTLLPTESSLRHAHIIIQLSAIHYSLSAAHHPDNSKRNQSFPRSPATQLSPISQLPYPYS